MTETLVTITLTRYAEPDDLVWETLESLASQEALSGEVVFLDQNWSTEFSERVESLATETLVFRCLPCARAGLSYARNEGLRGAANDIVLFIDPDAVAAPRWASRLASALLQEGVCIAGARIIPRWLGQRPLLARSRIVLDQYSLLDWGKETKPALRVVGAAFGVCRSRLPPGNAFDTTLGRRDGRLYSGEESELCRRVIAARGLVLYCGEAAVEHQILPERLNTIWVLRRLYYAGLSRAKTGGAPAPSSRLGFWDWLLLPAILPAYVIGWVSARIK